MPTLTARHLLVPLLAVIFLSGCASTGATGPPNRQDDATALTASALVQKNLAARGGAERLRAVDNLTWQGEIEMMGMKMPFRLYQRRPNWMRTEVEIPEMHMTIVSGYDGATAWMLNPMMGSRPQVLGPEQARVQAEMGDLDGPFVPVEDARFELAGTDTVAGRPVYRLVVHRDGNPEIAVYLDQETFLEVGMEGHGIDPETGAVIPLTYHFKEYRPVEGVLFPFLAEVYRGGTLLQTVRLLGAVANTAMPPTLFSPPGS